MASCGEGHQVNSRLGGSTEESDVGQIETKIDLENDLTVMTFRGEITAEEIRDKIDEYFQGRVTHRRMWDFQHASPASMTAEEIKAIVTMSQEYSRQMAGGKIAFVFPSKLAFGIGTMFNIALGMDMHRNEYLSFTDIDQAFEWLGKKQEQP